MSRARRRRRSRSHAVALEAALASGDSAARDQAVGRIERWLQTAGAAFQATLQLLGS